ncbi:unnamed protein product [Rangifer tarandus platyrhynchus]|uniref:Uncharacterized protein n=1 Tax=Rangifer tarandus platyrhynchus TaxID=3082113 RepID=A0AC59YFZ6_RANTA
MSAACGSGGRTPTPAPTPAWVQGGRKGQKLWTATTHEVLGHTDVVTKHPHVDNSCLPDVAACSGAEGSALGPPGSGEVDVLLEEAVTAGDRGLSAPEMTPGPTPYAPTPCQPPGLGLDGREERPHRWHQPSPPSGSRASAPTQHPWRLGSGARGVADCDAHMSQWDALGSPREAQPCTVSGLTGAIENACPARPGSHVGTAEQGGTHSDTPSWESVSTGYHVQQWNCWVTLLNPEKQQQRP